MDHYFKVLPKNILKGWEKLLCFQAVWLKSTVIISRGGYDHFL